MARHSSGTTARLEYALFRAAASTLRSLPLPRAVRVGASVGAAAAMVDRINRPIAMRNFAIAFPNRNTQEKQQILRGMYRNWGRMAAEWCHARDFTSANIARYVTYEGLENWEAGKRLSAGRGEIIVTGHFGNFELLSAAHALYGNQVAIVYRPLRNLMIDAEVSERRTMHGNLIIPRKGAGRQIMVMLRSNHDVVIPIDLDVRHGVFVDLFSLQASTTDSVARLAMATGAPVLPVFMVRQSEPLQHHIVIMPPIKVERTADRERAVREHTQAFTSIFEEMVRHHPDHWNWIHRRWKTRPSGEQRFY
jgi:Kdo2-lipid IVA lauroyltransferase/acyltransferase